MRAWTPSVPRLARLGARTTNRTYSCSSSSSANPTPKVGGQPGSTASAASSSSGSKLRLAMNARKLLGAGGVDGSGRLAMRRESIWASAHAHHSRKPVSAKAGRGSISGERAEGFTSSAAAYIADPHAFRPVHLYQPQFALHASFTPAHMPLPVHLGIQTYFKPDTRMADAEMFAPNDESKRIKAVENIVKVASHGNASTTHRKRMTNLREHLATVANFSTHPHLASLLESNPAVNAKSTESPFEIVHDPTVVFEGFALEEFHPNDFGPSSEFNRTTTFDEMVQVRLNGRVVEKSGTALSPVQEADLAWETVLDKMSAATAPSPAHPTTEPSLTLTTAVSEVESLLSRLGLAPSTAPGSTGGRSFIRGTSSRRMGRVAQRAFRPSRVSLVGVDLQMDEMAWMDSVKRKRQKKISKHKYKKRRKATRAERKKLGK